MNSQIFRVLSQSLFTVAYASNMVAWFYA